jgi:hypothetical protein
MVCARLGVRACKISFQLARQLTYQPIDDRCKHSSGGPKKTRNNHCNCVVWVVRRRRVKEGSEPDIKSCERKPEDAHDPRSPGQLVCPDDYRRFRCGMSAEHARVWRGLLFAEVP